MEAGRKHKLLMRKNQNIPTQTMGLPKNTAVANLRMSADRRLLHSTNKGFRRACAAALVAIATLLFTIVDNAVAGPAPMPVEVHLDLASHVVVGQITGLEQIKGKDISGDRWAIATIHVQKTLKGSNSNSLSVKLITDVNSGPWRPLILRPFKTGDSGIWVVAPDNTVSSWPSGLLPEQRTSEVVEILDRLEKRKWSVEVGGLKAWAGAVTNDHSRTPVIIFAIKNCSNSEIFIPTETERGVISATAVKEDGQTFKYVREVGDANEHVFCRRLGTGDVAYLHPRYTCINLASELKLSPATYQVVINYENSADGVTSAWLGEPRTPVQAWKGKLSTPALELLVAPQKRPAIAEPSSNSGQREKVIAEPR